MKNRRNSIKVFKNTFLTEEEKNLLKLSLEKFLLKFEFSGVFNIVIVDNVYIRNLNKEYRKIDKPTNVLSFFLGNNVLGEVYISKDIALIESKEYKIPLMERIIFLAKHGILHILGYTHEEMQNFLIEE